LATIDIIRLNVLISEKYAHQTTNKNSHVLIYIYLYLYSCFTCYLWFVNIFETSGGGTLFTKSKA